MIEETKVLYEHNFDKAKQDARRIYLLVQLASECMEVGHRITKALHFGLEQAQGEQPHSNAVRISQELTDLIATMRMCVAEKIIPQPDLGGKAITAKQQKIERFMAYAHGGERPADDVVQP